MALNEVDDSDPRQPQAAADGQLAVVSSFGAESAAILAIVAEIDRGTPVLFLDTGKLFGETLRYREGSHIGARHPTPMRGAGGTSRGAAGLGTA